MSKKYYSTKIDEIKLINIFNLLKEFEIHDDNKYVINSFIYDDLSIKVYKSKKGITLSIFGEESKIDSFLNKIDIKKFTYLSLDTQIGSDEVGNGDLLLPFIVVAVYINKENIDKILSLGINDSKKLSDERIIEIVPKLLKYIDFSKLTLKNSEYNEVISQGNNINIIKAKMHNRVLLNLKEKHEDVSSIFIDKFVSDEKFYDYLKFEKEIITNITSHTKGETCYPSVAVASMIARYSLIKERDKLSKIYNLDFPFGSSNKVDEFSIQFIKQYGLEEFKKIAKLDFKNIERII